MRFETAKAGEWEAANEACREAIGLPAGSDARVFAFRGLANAVWEISLGLARAFPHRRSVAYWQDEGALFEELAGQMSSDGCVARPVDSAEMRVPSWLDPIKKDILLLLEAVDDPISGEGLASPELEAVLKDSRAFRIRVSHAAHRKSPPAEVGPYEARVCAIDQDLAAAVCGVRVKFDPFIARRLPWRREAEAGSAESIRNRLRPASGEGTRADAEALQAFSSALPAGAKAIPASPLFERAPFDRVLFYFEDVDGSAVLDRVPHAGSGSRDFPAALSAGACRLADAGALERFLKSRKLPPQAGRGLIALSPEIATPATRAALEKARADVLLIQNGN